MDHIIAAARDLGKLIAAHSRTQAFLTAAKAVNDDTTAQTAMRAYQEIAERVQRLEYEGKPIEPADKRKLADAQAAVAGHPKLKDLSRHQADYLELMNRVNDAIEEAVGSHSRG